MEILKEELKNIKEKLRKTENINNDLCDKGRERGENNNHRHKKKVSNHDWKLQETIETQTLGKIVEEMDVLQNS